MRPQVRKAGVAEPVVYLEGGHYASIIPLDREGFDTNGAHYGFSKVSEYTSFSDGVVGFAANQSALAVATRIPQSIMNNPAYITKYAYQIPELGVNVLYVEWANANNGTMNAGIFYLCGMELAKADAAAVLVTDEFRHFGLIYNFFFKTIHINIIISTTLHLSKFHIHPPNYPAYYNI